MNSTSFPKSPSDVLLQQLQELGIQKGSIAKRLDIQASAVSDLYAGRRQLKYDEGMSLAALLPHDAGGMRLPIIPLASAIDWASAIENPDRTDVPLPSVVTKQGAFVVQLAGGLLNPPFPAPAHLGDRPHPAYAVIDPGNRQLFAGKPYLVAVGDKKRISVLWYCTDPARFEPAVPNAYEAPLSVGMDDFHVVGAVKAILQGY